MDIKGNMIQCPSCGMMNEAGSVFCGACGSKLPAQLPTEEANAFAQGLPGWDLTPPDAPVRRKRK